MHSVGDLKDLGFLVPDETVDFEGEDLLGKTVEVESCLIDLNVKDYDGFGDGLGLGSLWLGLLLGLGLFNGSGIIISKEIDVVLVLCGCWLGGSGCMLSSPSLDKCRREDANEVVPEVDVGMSVHIDVF